MPRGQKSKLRAREKRNKAKSESRGEQAPTAAEEEETPSSSSLNRGGGGSGARAAEMPSTSQALPNTDSSGVSIIDQKAILLVQFIIRKYNMGELITKLDMIRFVIKKDKAHFNEILKKASELMVLAFGIDVKESDPIRHYYILVSKLHPICDARLSGEIIPRNGLLMTILCVIFMKGNCANEEDVWKVLNAMGIHDEINHFAYGNVKKVITEDLVQEKYLEYQQVPDSDPPCYQFLWGPRAHIETSKMRVLEFLAMTHNTTPSAFSSWYEDALKDEEERSQTRLAVILLTSFLALARSNSFSHQQ
ncbi:PREDICTED: melanoma-associated antigen B18-like [Dipodomys ordii]|uniref:Melanoma-associated antigen B18-like n=1 Tax=Dipodomys ordii TaxID=10020 RepID=A0A1S3FZX3_DIPOR|nr:PREDICTED: melanoma-associated antigen B18-like [Dipodomys ordii]